MGCSCSINHKDSQHILEDCPQYKPLREKFDIQECKVLSLLAFPIYNNQCYVEEEQVNRYLWSMRNAVEKIKNENYNIDSLETFKNIKATIKGGNNSKIMTTKLWNIIPKKYNLKKTKIPTTKNNEQGVNIKNKNKNIETYEYDKDAKLLGYRGKEIALHTDVHKYDWANITLKQPIIRIPKCDQLIDQLNTHLWKDGSNQEGPNRAQLIDPNNDRLESLKRVDGIIGAVELRKTGFKIVLPCDRRLNIYIVKSKNLKPKIKYK